jgi:hypothetical protein
MATNGKAKIKCIAVLGSALVPYAVITATIRGVVYVWLDYDTRVELSQRLDGKLAYLAAAHHEAYPHLVRSHYIDVETGAVGFDDKHLADGRGTWMSGEGLWVRVTVFPSPCAEDDLPTARPAVGEGTAGQFWAALAAWREATQVRPDAISAPNWRTLTGVRALALAAGLPDPSVERLAYLGKE